MSSLKDHLNLLTKVDAQKAANAFRLFRSYHLSRWSKKNLHQGMPLSISIEPTTSCNLRCPECPSGLRSFTRPTGKLNPDFYKKIIDQIADQLVYLTFYFQGEPYLHPEFLSMVQYAHQKKIYTSTSTNAHYLTEKKARDTIASGLDRLIISIDGTDQKTYASYRMGGNLEKVIEGTKNLLALKQSMGASTPHVALQFLVVGPNEHQIPEIHALGKTLGVDEVLLKTAQIYEFENGSPLIPSNPKYARYKKNREGKYEIKNPLHNQCWKMWQSCVITWDGQVVPCCFDKDASHSMGNLNQHTFKEIWRGERYHQFRSSLLKARKEIDICKNCTEGTRIWA